jgi:hypothetical protein
MAGTSAERQETGFIDAVNAAVAARGSITLIAGSVRISNVTRAIKFPGRQASGSEPYTDVQLFIKNKTNPINISMKGPTAPSLAGGGLKGLELAVPGIATKFMRKVLQHLKQKRGFRGGEKVPDVYGKISDADKTLIVVGNAAMGGPIDYMYIGPMDVRGVQTGGSLVVNGKMSAAKAFANTHELYFRLRARREDQRFDPTAIDSRGAPKIYGRSPSRGDSAGRIVVTDVVPRNAEIITF